MRRVLAGVVGTVVVLAGLIGLVAAFSSRDDPGVAGRAPAEGPGRLLPDHGAGHDGQAPPAAELPASGPHRPRAVNRDAQEIDGDQLVHALELGNVVLAYGAERPPAALRRVQRELAGPFDAELAAAGQSVVLARVPGLDGVAALAWRRLLETRAPGDPAIAAFAERWLGRGAPR